MQQYPQQPPNGPYQQPNTGYPPFQQPMMPPQPYYPPPQGYIPGPVAPYPRPVRQNVKIAAIGVFAFGAVIAFLGGVYGTQLAGVCGLISFILMFFI